jgi:para-aminobenzoate synthetase component I
MDGSGAGRRARARDYSAHAVTWREITDPPAPDQLARVLSERPGFFFLDTGQAGEGGSERAFSFLGFAPFLTWRAYGDRILVDTNDGKREEVRQEPLAHLRTLMRRYHTTAANPPVPFGGGAVGYFTYEFGAQWEGIPPAAGETGGLPEAQFGFYDGVIAYDLAAGKTYAIAHPVADNCADTILTRLCEAVRPAAEAEPGPPTEPAAPAAEFKANVTREDYLQVVERAKDYIAAGDIYQVNVSHRFEGATIDRPYAIYRRLRRRSPAPYGAYLDAGEFQILSSSPELFLQLDRTGRLVTRPIKGTRPRGRTPAEDARLAAELRASEKDQAELLMIVDLERNDLGRVCRFGSVRVEERHRLETHPTVFHLVATISGRLREDRDIFDCLRAMFPGGSITGAPKIRAMQIIAELERCRRHVYTGSIGYLGFDGQCDLNIAIRTIVCRQGRASYHVGGGIVADSQAAAEYQETLDKGRALRAALHGEE